MNITIKTLLLNVVALSILLISCSCEQGATEEDAWTGPAKTNESAAELDFPQYEEWPFDEAEGQRRQEETAAKLGVTVRERIHLGDDVYLHLVLIPAGRYTMGFEDSNGNEPHEETIERPFYIGAMEMTYRQYQVFKQDEGAHILNHSIDEILEKAPYVMDHPIDAISWLTCNDYCKDASETLGYTIRLPWEREWEYAARAGTTGRFVRSDTMQSDDKKSHKTKGVENHGEAKSVQQGSLSRPNPWGVYDMMGSKGEWVLDMFGGSYGDNQRIGTIRSGSLGHEGIAERTMELRSNPGAVSGFRVVVEIDDALLAVLKKQKESKEAE